MYLKSKLKTLSGWGRFPKIKTNELTPSSLDELLEILNDQRGALIARGNGRSYGDSSINQNLTITMTKINKFIEWNSAKGELTAESGTLMSDIIEFCLPKGWFPFVSPGTKFVSLGGAIASDVHGKNHHKEGSFGEYVEWLDIIDETNQIIRCSRKENPDLFHWTIGGMGLTGIITKCCIKLKKIESGWISQKTIINHNFEETLQSFYENENATYSVAWIDCLSKGKNFGRSVLMTGEHSKKEDIPRNLELFPKGKNQNLSLFFDMPGFLLNNLTISIFNKFYFNLKKFFSKEIIHWDSYFYPLDSIKNWNRLYGKDGFFQFQCVLPESNSSQGYIEMLSIIQNESSGSFLAVLKNFGSGKKTLSFPEKGFTLALDFKATKKNIQATKKLIKIAIGLNGKIYLSKDTLMDKNDFRNQCRDQQIESMRNFSNNRFQSEQSERIGI